MRLCSRDNIELGMVLGKSIYDGNGRLLLGAGFRLNEHIVIRLAQRGYNHVYIMEAGTEAVLPQDIISDEIRYQAATRLADKTEEIKKTMEFVSMGSDKMDSLIQQGKMAKISFSADIRGMVSEILKDIASAGAKFMSTLMFKSQDTYFMDHALNVTVLTVLIAQKYGFTQKELSSLALGSFLHDIGKIIIEKMSDSTSKQRDALFPEHPTYGYLLLKNDPNITPIEAQVVNQHHELQDGSGFPIGLTGDNSPPVKAAGTTSQRGRIFRYAEICCVANAYDAMVLNPNNDQQLDPQEAIRRLIVESGTKYNKDIVQTLTQVVPAYPVGAYVKILAAQDQSLVGSMGVVAKINEDAMDKPVIILTKDRFMKSVKPDVVDTAQVGKVSLKLVL